MTRPVYDKCDIHCPGGRTTTMELLFQHLVVCCSLGFLTRSPRFVVLFPFHFDNIPPSCSHPSHASCSSLRSLTFHRLFSPHPLPPFLLSHVQGQNVVVKTRSSVSYEGVLHSITRQPQGCSAEAFLFSSPYLFILLIASNGSGVGRSSAEATGGTHDRRVRLGRGLSEC